MNKKEFIKKHTHGKSCVNHHLCSTCSDVCCEQGACDALPFDIEPFTPKHIIELIDKGRYSIVSTVRYKGKFYPSLRSREQGKGVFDLDGEDKPCSLLGENGCTLTEEERPTLALLLIPKARPLANNLRVCKQLVKKKTFVELWKEQEDIMEIVVKHYTGGKDFKTFCESQKK